MPIQRLEVVQHVFSVDDCFPRETNRSSSIHAFLVHVNHISIQINHSKI